MVGLRTGCRDNSSLLTCQSIQRVGQMLVVTFLGCSSWEQLANCMLIRVHTQLLLPMLGGFL